MTRTFPLEACQLKQRSQQCRVACCRGQRSVLWELIGTWQYIGHDCLTGSYIYTFLFLFFRKQTTHTRAHTKSSLGMLLIFFIVFCLVVCFGVNLFVTIFLCSVFVSRSFVAALPFQRQKCNKLKIPEYLNTGASRRLVLRSNTLTHLWWPKA